MKRRVIITINTIESEKAIIGCLIMFPEMYGNYILKLSNEFFSTDINVKIITAIRKVYKETGLIDVSLVVQECCNDDNIKIVIMECAESVFKSTPFEEHYKVILRGAQERYFKRELEYAIINNKLTQSYLQCVVDVGRRAFAFDNEVTTETLIDEFSKNLTKPREVIYTYFPTVDKATGGLRRGTLTIIGARPSVGKTTLAVNIATETALHNKKTVIFTLEMSAEMILQKIASSKCNIPYSKFNSVIGNTDSEIITDYFAKSNLKENMIINDDINSIENICGHILSTSPDIVLIDYAQIISTVKTYDNKRLQMDYISGELKRVAKQTNCCIVLLSQLKRNDVVRPPTMADLKESGGLEQDGDYIFLLYRPFAQDKVGKDENGNRFKPEDTTLCLEKNKFGMTGVIEMRFNGKYQEFKEVGFK